MKRTSYYKLSRNYWKELDKLDNTLFNVGEITDSELVRGNVITNVRAAWDAKNANSMPIGWFGKKTEFGLRLVAQLAIGENVESLVAIDNGGLATIYKYSSALKRLRVGHEMIHNEIDIQSNQNLSDEEMSLEDSINDVVGKDSYDVLIEEMRRGASGDYAFPFPPGL